MDISNEIILYTQVASIIGFISALFILYHLLVKYKQGVIEQKDGVIELLREQLKQQENKIKELLAQSPDVLAKSLNKRIKIAVNEIERLNLDSIKHEEEINQKESDIQKYNEQLTALHELITDTDLVCPYCNSRLSKREFYPIHANIDGRECEADAEYSMYECGFETNNGSIISPCPTA